MQNIIYRTTNGHIEKLWKANAKSVLYLSLFTLSLLTLFSCTGKTKRSTEADTIALAPAPAFAVDSAMAYIEAQCAFGPRVPGSAAHKACGDWIAAKFQSFGCQVVELNTTVVGYDGTNMPCRNIQARLNPDAADRILLTAHWDSRAWADHDADDANHRTPVMAANDGASGVAVMLEVARSIAAAGLSYGVDFVCFDVEDQGTPEWAESGADDDIWCLGSKSWAEQAFAIGYQARYGINLDMVGGRGGRFAMEGFSRRYASTLVGLVWHLAHQLGYGEYFPLTEAGYVTDDHLPVNTIAHIPAIDIIAHQEGADSSFGPTWHTTSDTPENIDPAVMQAVGQTLLQLIYNDN